MKKSFIFLLVSVSVFASSFVEIESKYNAKITVKKISTLIKRKKGFSVFTVINHHENANKIGMKLPFESVIVFGNPHAGTKLMQTDALIGYELPLRIMVYEKGDKVIVVYKKPKYLAENYMVEGSPVLVKMKKVMKSLTLSIKK